jgi:hypothetical protein
MEEPDQRRILALDVRPRSFAFVVFGNSHELLDWGARSFRGGLNAVRVPRGPKVMRLIDEYVPEVLVLKNPQTKTSERIIHGIRKQAKLHRITVRLLSQNVVKETFAGRNRNKHQIASAIAERFPELLYILPPKRKPWQSEDYRMSIFDAAAVGTAYFEPDPNEGPIPNTTTLKNETFPPAPGVNPTSGSNAPD